MTTFEISDILSACIGIFALALSVFFTIRIRQTNTNLGKWKSILLGIVFFIAICIFIVTIIFIIKSPTNVLSGNIILFILTLLAILINTFASIFILYQALLLRNLRTKRTQLKSEEHQFEASKEEQLQLYRKKILPDTNYTKIQTFGTSRPLNLAEAYIPLKVQIGEYPSSFVLDPASAILKYKKCVIVGNPGSGKTTLLKHLLLQTSENKLPPLPIFINLRSFLKSNKEDLLEYALSTWEIYGFVLNETRGYVKSFIKDRKVILLLDALDETFIEEQPEANYNHVVSAINSLAKQYPKLYIVVTARKAAYLQQMQLTNFQELEVLPFSTDNIRNFVDNMLELEIFKPSQEKDRKALAHRFKADIESNHRFKSLAANPLFLLLTVIAYQGIWTYQIDRSPPKNFADLCQRYAEALLYKWDRDRGKTRSTLISVKETRQILQHVALQFLQQEQTKFRKDQLTDAIASINVPDMNPESILNIIASESGLLKQDDEDTYSFLYPVFQEYFAACEIALQNNTSGVSLLMEHIHEFRWENVVIFYAAKVSDATPLLTTLLETDDFFSTNLCLAGHCLAVGCKLSNPSQRKDIEEALFNLLNSQSPSLICDLAAESLADMEDLVITGRLLDTLSKNILTPEPATLRMCESITTALGNVGGTESADRLFKLLTKCSDVSLSKSIARALGKLSNFQLIDKMKDVLDGIEIDDIENSNSLRENIALRQDMALALGETRERSVANDLLGRLQNPQGRGVRVLLSIIDALNTLHEPDLAPALAHLLSKHRLFFEDPKTGKNVRKRIIEVIGNLGNQTVASDLQKLFDDPQFTVEIRCSIANALSELNNREIIPDLLHLYYQKRSPQEHFYIATALYRLGEVFVGPDLLAALKESNLDRDNPDLRKEIVISLATIENPEIQRSFFQLQRPSIFVRRQFAAFTNRNNWSKEYLVSQLLSLIDNKQLGDGIRKEIVSMVGVLGTSFLLPELMDKLANKDISLNIRAEIAMIAGNLATQDNDKDKLKDCAEKLKDLLNNPEVMASLDNNKIYRALWKVSQHLPKRIIIKNPQTNQFEITEMQQLAYQT